MKKLAVIPVLLAAIFISKSAAGQITNQTASFNLSIDLQDVISIALGGSPDVSFTYSSASDYANSKTVSKSAHFTVISTQNYNITVTAGGVFSVNAGNSTPVPLNVVNVEVNRTGMSSGVGGSDVTATLSTSPQPLVNGASPTIGSTYNINYTIPTAESLVGKVADTYTTTVIYTATQI